VRVRLVRVVRSVSRRLAAAADNTTIPVLRRASAALGGAFMRVHRKRLWLLAVLSLGSIDATWAQKPAAPWPGRLVRIVVPYSPGIGVDLAARTVAPKFAERLGQAVIVENKPGASAIIGTEFVARAPADGYTLGMVVTTLAITAATRTVAFDPVKDFAPVGKIGAGAFLLTVNAAVPARTLQDLVALAKASPGKLNYGTPGAGTPGHLAMELLKQLAGIDLFHVPYKGMPASVIGHASGDVPVMITPLELARPHIASGKLRALAVTGARRVPEFPDLATVAELGYPGFGLELWYGLLAPAATPPAVLERLNAELVQILAEPDVREAMKKQGIDPQPGPAAELGAQIRDEVAKWKRVAAAANLKIEE
jgi:tripartite-type tricarboxylate transporter receptor subunit TctC